MKQINVDQGTQEWHELRRCKITGTKLADVMGSALLRVQLIADLIAQEATEQTKSIRATEAMERGTAEEVFAIKLFEKQTGKKFTQGGMWLSDEYDYLACSPDASGEVDEEGDVVEAVEVKNPDTDTLFFYKMVNMIGMEELGLGAYSKPTKKNPEVSFKPSSKNPFLGIPPEYKWQCVNYFLTNRKLQRLYFLVHDARIIDESQRLYVVTIERTDPELIKALERAEYGLVKFREDWMKWKEVVLPIEI